MADVYTADNDHFGANGIKSGDDYACVMAMTMSFGNFNKS